MSTGTHLITAEQFAEMHIEVPTELVRGKIVNLHGEGPNAFAGMLHGFVCANAAWVLGTWSRKSKTGLAAGNNPGVITQQDPDTVRTPDLFFVSHDRLPKGRVPEGIPEIAPNLCVEVLTHLDQPQEVDVKCEEYLACGVDEVWVLDPELQSVAVIRADTPTERFAVAQRLVSDALPGFSCPVSDFFEDT